MNRAAFLAQLETSLRSLPIQVRDEFLGDYRSHFDEASAEGRSEAETAKALGNPDLLAREYLQDYFNVRQSRNFSPVFMTQAVLVKIGLIGLIPYAGPILLMAFLVIIAGFTGLTGAAGLQSVLIDIALFILAIVCTTFIYRFVSDRKKLDTDTLIEQELLWSPGQSMTIAVAADVSWKPAAHPKATIKTYPWLMEHLQLNSETLHSPFKVRFFSRYKIQLELEGPAIPKWLLIGSGTLHLQNIQQSELDLSVEGSGDIIATGFTDHARINIKGTGEIDIGQLSQRETFVNLNGMGDATIAPTERAIITMSGRGDVKLLTHPPVIETTTDGKGDIRFADGTLIK
ncbi:DUF1700 domain-containing protein [Microvirga sp. W0021]|uniref:DUF1700 domain-containing protein n=1 Tax=Hohaiivirga grylli TaxID=3133970 RepID=A0ABV0BG62_9HYPH